MHSNAWVMVNEFMAEMAPTWPNVPKKKKGEEGVFAWNKFCYVFVTFCSWQVSRRHWCERDYHIQPGPMAWWRPERNELRNPPQGSWAAGDLREHASGWRGEFVKEFVHRPGGHAVAASIPKDSSGSHCPSKSCWWFAGGCNEESWFNNRHQHYMWCFENITWKCMALSMAWTFRESTKTSHEHDMKWKHNRIDLSS